MMNGCDKSKGTSWTKSRESWELTKPMRYCADLRVRRPWERYPVLLRELMKSFKVHDVLLDIVEDIGELSSLTANSPDFADDVISADIGTAAIQRLEDAERLACDFGFKTLIPEIARNRRTVESGCDYAELGRIALNLRNRIQDEFEDVTLVWVQDKEYFSQAELFGRDVADRFKSASFDIQEAGTCYSLGRYTASVYHLMRVSEFGLQAIAKRVQYPDDRPMWETVLKYIDSQLNKKRDEIAATFKGDIEFISGIAAHMHDVNLAWRRRVSHIERSYTKEEAERVMDATKALMEHVATKLSETE